MDNANSSSASNLGKVSTLVCLVDRVLKTYQRRRDPVLQFLDLEAEHSEEEEVEGEDNGEDNGAH